MNWSKINIKGLKTEDWTRVIFLLLVVVLAAYEVFNNNATLEAGITTALFIITTIWNTWKNFNLTAGAQVAQEALDKLKKGEIKDINYVKDDENE